MTQPSGPSAASPWAARPADPASPDASGTVLTVPDATDAGLLYHLPDHLAVASGADGAPVLSLTVLLDGVPDPAQPDVEAHVTGGSLAVDVALAGPAPLPAAGERELRPLFARSVDVDLLAADGRVIASGAGAGASARVALATTLSRDDVLAVLGALDGGPASLSLQARIAYRAVGAQVTVHLTGRWCDVHDALRADLGPAAPVSRDDLGRVFARLAGEEILVLSHPDAGDAVFGSFAAMAEAVLLDADGLLGRRPTEYFAIDLSRTTTGSRSATTEIGAPLERTLGGVLDGADRDAHVSLVSVAPPAGKPSLAVSRTPRRVSGAARAERRPVDAPLRLVAEDQVLVAPARLHAADALVTAEPHRMIDLAPHRAELGDIVVARLDDDVVAAPDAPVPSMPVVDDEAGWAFPDRAEPSNIWYVPSFDLMRPVPSDTAATSPFTFSFARSGVNQHGDPGLDATVTFRLREVRGGAAEQALAVRGGAAFRPVPTSDASVTLELPFRDDAGVTRSQRFPARVVREGDVLVASVDLIDSWARLCYGALSVAGFQAQPARVEVAWSFGGCALLHPWQFEVVAGSKAAVLQLAEPVETAQPLLAVEPVEVEPLVMPIEPIQPVETPVAVALRALEVRMARRDGGNGGNRRTRLPRRPIEVGDEVEVIARPDLVIRHPIDWRPRYVERTYLRSQSFDLLIPCSDFGACYVERRPEGDVPIGCQDALRLGQTTWRQYEEIAALADPAYRVYRSLQQPGRFLVLPAAYRVSRAAPQDTERAYRPLILLYALLDPADAAHNRVMVEARLQPDISPAARARLRARLGAYAAAPVIVFPTEADCTGDFAWGVSITGMTVSSTLQPDGVAASFSTGLEEALLLRDVLTHTGVPGSVGFTFPDGTRLTSGLLVSLRELTGPLQDGPIEVTLAGDQATLVNRIERPLDVSELLVAAGQPQPVAVPVEQSLAAAASVQVAVPSGASAAYADYALPPTDPVELEEVRAFVEDIRTNVVFLDLVDHTAHRVAALTVRARLDGVAGEQQVPMSGSPASGSVTFVLPLTTYLSRRILQFQAATIGADGSVRPGPWVDWDLGSKGALVSLTWDALALPELQEIS